MNYGYKPLYPPSGDNCIRLPLFGNEPCPRDLCDCAQTVRLENPSCPGECAIVSLSVDSCGNLVICVRREPPRCDPQPRCECRPRPPRR